VRQLGVVLKGNLGPEVSNVLDTLPAGESGLAPEDVLLRVNGYPYSLKALKWAIAHESTVRLDVQRGHRTFSFEVSPATVTRIGTLAWAGTEAQAQRIRRWLGQAPFAPTPGQSFSLKSFENFHGIQTVI